MDDRDPNAGYNTTQTEAVAVFHDAARFQAAIDELLSAGFDHAELSVLASEAAITAKLGHGYESTTEFEDDPDVPRMAYVPRESVGDAQGAVIGLAAYVPAIVGSVAVIGSGGTLLGAIGAAALAGGGGAAVGAWLAHLVGNRHAATLEQHLHHGGLLLWVRTHDARHEQRALAILERNGGKDIHLHTLAAPKAPRMPIPTRQPLLFGRVM